MRRTGGLLVAAVVLGLAGRFAFAEPEPSELRLHGTARTPGALAAHRLVDVQGDGRTEIFTVGKGGEVRVHRCGPEGVADEADLCLVLDTPERCLLAVADVLGIGTPQLAVLSPAGLSVHRARPDGTFARGAEVLAADARFRLRVGAPRFAPILDDLNGDGRPDLSIPGPESVELWINEPPAEEGGLPRFSKVAAVSVKVRRNRSSEAGALSDVLETTLVVPRLDFEDHNGDGRADLVVSDGSRRAYHLQGADGTIAPEPDVVLDLDLFRDTTPEADVRLGRTLAGDGDARVESADLDGDGFVDHVVAHRRKVWVFHGTAQGPQFKEPSAVLRVSEDVTGMLLIDLDADGRSDLLLFRVQVPALGTILRGMLASFDVDVTAIGYANDGRRGFARTPTWSGDLALRVPAIVSILRDAEALVRRFEDATRQFRRSVALDADGDGAVDVALLDPEGTRIDVWLGTADAQGEVDAEAEVRRILFEDEDRVWDVDRLVGWLSGVAQQRAGRITGGRPPEGTIALREEAGHERLAVESADLDGDGREELVVTYRRRDGAGQGEIDVLTWR